MHLKAAGRCNVYNALAAFAAMRRYGFDEREICRGLESFTAVKRRFEHIGNYAGAAFILSLIHISPTGCAPHMIKMREGVPVAFLTRRIAAFFYVFFLNPLTMHYK